MYRNLTFFRFPLFVAAELAKHAATTIDGSALQDDLAARALKPVAPLELSSRGWVPPVPGVAGSRTLTPEAGADRDDFALISNYGSCSCHINPPCGYCTHPGNPMNQDEDAECWVETPSMFRAIGDCVFLSLGGEDKVLPGSAVNAELAKRLKAIEESEGRKPGGRTRKRVKDEVITDLLPRALVKPFRLDGYLDLRRGLVVVDTASRKAAEGFVSELRGALGSFSALPLNAEIAPRSILTCWVAGENLPEGSYNGDTPAGGAMFLGDECELREPLDQGAVVKCQRQELESDEIAAHLKAGMQCARLGLVLDDRISFVLGEDLTVRKFKLLDTALDSLDGVEGDDLAAHIDASLALLSLEVGAMFDVLEPALKLSKVEA